MYYNDQPPDTIFYQGLAQRAMGQENQAVTRFERLLAYGREHLNDRVTIDYFAVSLPDFLVFDEDLNRRNAIHCLYLMALGHLGLGDTAAAAEQFERVLAMDPAHLGAAVHRADKSIGSGIHR
jgi:tetratricopeptide (TPR) repeat protein